MLTLGNKLTLNSQPIYKFVNKYSVQFDGSDQRIITDGADTVAQLTTYSFWCKSSVSGANKGIFGHGGDNKGAFHYWSDSRPLIYLGANWFVKWDISSKQSDGEWHHWVVYSDPNNLNNCKLYVDGVLQNVYQVQTAGSLEAYTQSLTIGSDRQVGGNSFEGQIDEFAVYDRELTQAEITRMYNTYYSPNRVANGNFSQIGNEEVTNGDFSQIGSEEIVNGDFDTSIAIGTNGSGWSRFVNGDNTVEYGSGGVILTRGSNSSTNECKLYANTIAGSTNILTTGKNYKLTYTVVANTNVTALAYYVGGTYTNLSHNVGTHTLYFTQGSNQLSVFWNQTTSSSITIDNVSVKEVGQDWTATGSDSTHYVEFLSTGARFVSDTVSPVLELKQNAITSGKQYVLTCNVAYTGAGQLRVNVGSNLTAFTEGANTRYFTATSGTMSFLRENANVDALLSNLSVKEVGQHWTFGSSWSTNGTEAIFTTGSGTVIESPIGLIGNRTYRVSCVVTGSPLTLYMGTNTVGISVPVGTYNANLVTASNTNGTIGFLNNGGGASGTLDNIVVQELKHDATNLMLNAGAYQSANPLITSTKSMEFDGIDETLLLTDITFNAGNSIAMWLNPSEVDNYRSFFGLGTTYSYVRMKNGTESTSIEGETDTNSDHWNITASGTIFEVGKWTYMVLVWNSDKTWTMYINGVSRGTSSATTDDSMTIRYIGRGYQSENEFVGNITEVGYWDRTLTALEVASLYNQGMPTNLLVNRNNYQSGNPTVFNTKQVDFDGTDDYMIANSTLGSFTGTVSMWVKRDTNTTVDFLIEFRGLGGTGVGYIYINANTSTISVSSGTVYVDGVAGTTISVGQWHHIVVTGITLNITESLLFGRQYPGAHYLDGDMSQVGLWNSTLTADEVSSLYNHGLPIDLTTDQAAYASSSNLVGYWRMGSGTLDSYPVIFDQTNATLGLEMLSQPVDLQTDFTAVNGASFTDANTLVTTGGSVEGFTKTSFLTLGRTYKLIIAGTTTSSGFTLGNTTGGGNEYGSGFGTHYFTASDNTAFWLRQNTAGTTNITSFTLKEVQGNPAIMTNQTSTDIENGSPYANIVQDSDFSEDSSDWSVGTGWQILNGKANVNATSFADLTQNIGTITGKTYRISYEVSNYVTGSVKVMLGYGSTPELPTLTATADGVYTVETTANTTNPHNVYVSTKTSTTQLSIDNVTVEEVNTGLQGYWKMGDGTNDEYPAIYDQVDPTLSSDLVTGDNSATTVAGAYTDVATNWAATINDVLAVTFTLGGDYRLKLWSWTYYNAIDSSIEYNTGTHTAYITVSQTVTHANAGLRFNNLQTSTVGGTISNITVKKVNGNLAYMTNMVEGNITNQYPLTKIRNYYRMGDGILDGYPIIQDQTSPNLAHIPTTNLFIYSEDFSQSEWIKSGVTLLSGQTSPIGDTSAFKLTFSADNDYIQDHITGLDTSKKYTLSFYAKVDSGTTDIDCGNIDAGVTEIRTITDEWVRYEITQTPNESGRYPRPIQARSASVIYLWGCQFEEQSQATAYLKSDGIAAVRKSSTTNLITYSEDFSQSVWSKVSSEVVLSNITSPLDSSYAYKLQTLNNSNQSRTNISVTTVATNRYTFSVYVKKADYNYVALVGLSPSSTNYFDLVNGTTYGGSTGVYTNIANAGNGWYRCSVNFIADTTTKNAGIYLSENGTSINLGGVADGKGVYIWGAQLELQTQAETYAKTTGLPVTIDLFTENNYGTMTNMSASDIVEDTP